MEYFLKHQHTLKERLKDKYIMLFLDYDGTLTPIVESPDKAVLNRKVKGLLKELSIAPNCKLAIISGRALNDIKKIVGIKNIIYAGNHGLEIEGPKIKFETPVSPRFKAALKQIKDDLSIRLSSINGAFIEDKGLSLSLHYRLVDKKDIPQVKTIFHEITILYSVRNKTKIRSGKMVLEVRPPVEWDKGKAVLWLLARQQFILGKNRIFPIYIGDDVTDENVFKALKKKGLTIFVGNPRPSYAQYYLKNTEEVKEFLKRILKLKTDTSICQN